MTDFYEINYTTKKFIDKMKKRCADPDNREFWSIYFADNALHGFYSQEQAQYVADMLEGKIETPKRKALKRKVSHY